MFLQSGPTDVLDDCIPINEPSRPRYPSDYETPISPVNNNSQSDQTPLLTRGHYEYDENYKVGSTPRYQNTPSNGLSNAPPIEEYDGAPEYTEIDEPQAPLEYSEIDDSVLQREYSEINDDEFDEGGGGYSAVPKEFQAPPPAKLRPASNGAGLRSDVFEMLNASDMAEAPTRRLRSRTFTTPPKEEYETPIDAGGVVAGKASTLQHPPLLTDYETPIDASVY